MTRPRIGFLGTGWIGRHRMAAMRATDEVAIAAIVDPSEECAREALAIAPEAVILPSFEAMLEEGLDGVVIASPSALHAEQAIAALDRGAAVFCQKPLGRCADETRRVIAAAEEADRLLAVDFSYRHTAAAKALAELVGAGALGEIFAADLVFHNAYGPDKPWFYDKAQSGGGCMIDLGIHLADLVLWLTGFPAVGAMSARMFSEGRPVGAGEVEDYATASFNLAGGAAVRLACSWRLNAGQDAVIAASLYGTRGGATLRNVGGSFYDLELLHLHGTSAERLVAPPDEWGGRAAAAWARALAADPCFDADAWQIAAAAKLVEQAYQAAVRD